MTDYAGLANAERQDLFAELEQLTDDQWSTMTCCDPWTVRHLIAHMTALGNQTAPNFFIGLIRNGFSFDKFVARDLEKFNQGTNADVLAGFERTLSSTKSPPGPGYVPLGEYTTHGEDIRRAVGIKADRPEERLVALAGAYVKTGAPLGGKKRAAGLQLRATDVDWQAGGGPEVAGAAMDIIRAMVGRTDGLDSCTGAGVDILRSRC